LNLWTSTTHVTREEDAVETQTSNLDLIDADSGDGDANDAVREK